MKPMTVERHQEIHESGIINNNWGYFICPYCSEKNSRSTMTSSRFGLRNMNLQKWSKCDKCKKRVNFRK